VRERLCKSEVTGSIPVRSIAESPAKAGFSLAASFGDSIERMDCEGDRKSERSHDSDQLTHV
jgi:hypothetical protein